MLSKFCLFLLLITTVTANSLEDDDEFIARTKRAAKNSWGFFEFLGSITNLFGEQYTDTKSTFNQIYNLLQDTFSDTATTTEMNLFDTTTYDMDDNETEIKTTTQRYRITRYEAGRILGRNFRGLQNLIKLELQDALNQSQYNIQEYNQAIQDAKGPGTPQKISKSKRKLNKRHKYKSY